MKRTLLLLLALIIATTQIGATALAESVLASDLSTLDLSQEVNLVISIYNTPQIDIDLVNEAASKITKEKINATVELQYMPDFTTQYPLVLSTGEDIDLIWTATWMNCWNYCNQGAFQDLTELVNDKFPALRDMIGKNRWDSIAVNDKYYLVPAKNGASVGAWAGWGVAYREDLRKQLGCPEIDSFEDMETYAKAIKDAGMDIIPFCDGLQGGLIHGMLEKEHIFWEFADFGNPMGLNIDTMEIVDYTKLDSFRELVETQRRWVKSGYVQSDIASSTDQGTDGMLSGKYAGAIINISLENYMNQYLAPISAAHPDWEMGFAHFGAMYKTTYQNSAAEKAIAVPRSSKNAERALAFLELVLTDDELFNLFDCGIRGTHYEVDENGYYASLQGNNVTYARGTSWLDKVYVNDHAKIYTELDRWGVDYANEHMLPYQIEDYWSSFPFDTSEYSEYVTPIQNAVFQYEWSLVNGATDDIEGTLQTFWSQCESNGFGAMKDSIQRQWDAYCQEKGLK